MKKRKLLAALLLCTAATFPLQALSAEQIFEGVYENYNNPGGYYGAGFVDSGTSAIVKAGTQFINNKAGRAAGIYNYRNASLTVEDNVVFKNNQALSNAGGAIQNFGTAIMGNNLVFEDNKAAWGGAAIYAGSNAPFGHSTTIGSGAVFKNNTLTAAASYGGAIFIENDANADTAKFTLGSNATFENNSAMQGGAIYVKNAIDAVIAEGAKFTGNTATGDGGAVYNLGNTSIANATFSGNTAQTNGGAVYNAGKITVGGTFTNNSAQQGGAIYNANDLTVADGSIFSGNSATYTGSAISNYAEKLVIGDNVKFLNNTTLMENPPADNPKTQMGTIYSEGTASRQNSITIGNNVLFEGNKSGAGSGLYLYGNNDVKIGANAQFINNVTQASLTDTTPYSGGGAIALISGSNGAAKIEIGENAKFEGNIAEYAGAINVNSADSELKVGANSQFINNKAEGGEGGAIYNAGTTTISEGSVFTGNSAIEGGAIFNEGTLNIAEGAQFSGNTSADHGGAIYNSGKANITGIFNNNSADNDGGAIYVSTPSTETKIAGVFDNNMAGDDGGAIVNYSANTTIGEGTTFTGNVAKNGGAIFNYKTMTIEKGTTFTGNSATAHGGAIYNLLATTTINENSVFKGNSASMYGGAVYVKSGTMEIGTDATFIENSAKNGGAIYNNSAKTTIAEGATFVGNTATADGGAIYTTKDLTLTDATFTGNTATGNGGAIYTTAAKLTLNAVDKDVIFSGNSAANGADIFMSKKASTLVLNAADGKSIKLEGGVSGNEQGFNIEINNNPTSTTTYALRAGVRTPSTTGGTVIINSAIQNATINVDNGTLHLAQGSALNNSTVTMADNTTLNTIDGAVSSFAANTITLGNNVNLALDVDLANGSTDRFAENTTVGSVTIAEVNPIGNTTANNVSVNILESLGLNPNNVTISSELQTQTQRVLTPIRYLQGSISETGLLTMAPTGNSYKDFNPAVMASSVASQLGGYLTQLNSYDQAFRNMDMYMLMPKKQREAMKLRNKYAAADGNLVFDPLGTQYDDKAVWFRPYATFENVPLKGGPRVSNVAYGSFFGGDSELYDLGHGWDGMLSVYAGYNGSHQAYDGIGIYQNGGTLGLTGMAYKGNFFTGLTLNAGANAGEANTAYGRDNFSMLMAGIANKTGYNIEFADGKFVIQPNLQLSYSFVNTFDYRNAAGVKVNSDPLNAIQIEPGIKFIGNLKNGWQPYAGVSVVWNIIDKTKFSANDVSLPELSIKPYVRYGLGVRKAWGEVCTGFLQTYFTNGGRNGVGFQSGFRFTLGKGGLNSLNAENSTPELPKTKINLSSAK